jgi:hypothetical protein
MARRTPPRKVRYFEPVAPRLARNTVIESTFEVGRRYRCTMPAQSRCGDPPGPRRLAARMANRLDEKEPADWRAPAAAPFIISPR